MSTDGLCFCEQRSHFLPEKPLGKFRRRWSLCSTCCHCCTHIPLDPLPFSCTVAPICFHSRQPAWVSEDHWCCFGCEDTFNFVSSARSESYKCLAIPPPPQWQPLTDEDGCSSMNTSVPLPLDSEVWLHCLYSSPCRTEPNLPSVGQLPFLPFSFSCASTGCFKYTS